MQDKSCLSKADSKPWVLLTLLHVLILTCNAHRRLGVGDKQANIKLNAWMLLTLLCNSTCSVNQPPVHAPNHLQELNDTSAVMLAVALHLQQQLRQH